MDTQPPSLSYEETPPIEPAGGGEPDIFPPPKPKSNVGSVVTTGIILILLFVIGFWLSGFVRQYMGNFFKSTSDEEAVVPTPTPIETGGLMPLPTEPANPQELWNTYQVLNGKTRTAYEGISFRLPPDVLAPVCDGSSCKSQGTYLPGGTRFTVALRGEGQVLPDFRGKIISDLKGISFPVTEKTLSGISAKEFNGTFVGTTVSGYVFTRMRGYMIPIAETVSFEINHFSPRGSTPDFEADDALFDQIISTLMLPPGFQEKGEEILTPTPSPVIGQ